MSCWLNGEFREERRAIDIADRGFLLGDGVFETVLLLDGVPAFWDAHMARLDSALEALQFPVRASVFSPGDARALAARAGADAGQAALRVTVTRGARGLAPPAAPSPTLLMTVSPVTPSPDGSAALMVGAARRSAVSLSSRYKTAGYLDNIMARGEAAAAKADDAVMLNEHGRVACASAANVFMLSDDGVLLTPAVSEGALPGIVRGLLLARAREGGFEAREAALAPADLRGRGLVLTNSLMGARPARLGAAPPRRAGDRLAALRTWYKTILLEDVEQRARRI